MAERQRLTDMTLGDIFKSTERYRPVMVLVVAVFLIVTLLPGKPERAGNVDSSSSSGDGSALANGGQVGGDGTGTGGDAAGADTGTGAGTVGTGGAVGGSGTGAAAGGAGSGRSASGSATGSNAIPVNANAMGPDCDPATGRVRMPSVYAMPCVAPFQGDNGGATYKLGVTKSEITIAIYRGQPDAAAQAILVAAGDTDTEEQLRQQYLDDIELFSRHTELYGRKIKPVFVDGSGEADDQDAGKADAIKVATEVKAFMSWGSPNNAYLNELTARGVLCVCTTTLPKDFYLAHAPYVWGNGLPDQHQAYTMRAEMICKQIKGRKARWAGDAALAAKDRTFGLIYYETADKAYEGGIKFFEQELAKCNVKLADKAAYIFDTNTAQQDSTTIIAKFNSEGITSVIFAGDFIYPIFYTQAATNQNYHPEWIITGSALTDTTLFARTYDQNQWSHAFGLALLSARAPRTVSESWRIYQWHFGHDPAAPGTQGTIWPNAFLTFVGLQGAGPKLTPQTFRDGMFKYPLSPKGPHVTNGLVSWGKQLWAWDDYNLYDDVTEIWWDAQASGPDEYDRQGVGVYRWVAGGKRFLPGGIPTGEFPAFNPAGTVIIYNTLPAEDKNPEYPHKDYH